MPGIVLFTLVVVIIVIVVLFLQDAKRARAASPPRDDPPREPAQRHASRQAPTRPAPEDAEDPLDGVDVEALTEHVRGLRRAVEEGLIGRDEAIASIVRQGDGQVGEGMAEHLLDRADLD